MIDHPKVLVVDDEKTIREIVSRTLGKMGCECTQASDGRDAIEFLLARSFDLVITDLKMPRMGGLALIEWLRQRHPALPIVIMTGYADVESARKALKLRVSDYLMKPFEGLSEVQSAVQRALLAPAGNSDTGIMVREFEERARLFERRERNLTASLDRAKVELEATARRLKASEALSSKQFEQVESLIDNLSSGVVVTDRSGVVMSVNQQMWKLLQVPNMGDNRGVPVERLPGDPELREVVLESRSMLISGSEEPVLMKHGGPDGDRTIEVRSRYVNDASGAVTGVVTIVRALKAVQETRMAVAG